MMKIEKTPGGCPIRWIHVTALQSDPHTTRESENPTTYVHTLDVHIEIVCSTKRTRPLL